MADFHGKNNGAGFTAVTHTCHYRVGGIQKLKVTMHSIAYWIPLLALTDIMDRIYLYCI
jgi:hypothetical protein